MPKFPPINSNSRIERTKARQSTGQVLQLIIQLQGYQRARFDTDPLVFRPESAQWVKWAGQGPPGAR